MIEDFSPDIEEKMRQEGIRSALKEGVEHLVMGSDRGKMPGALRNLFSNFFTDDQKLQLNENLITEKSDAALKNIERQKRTRAVCKEAITGFLTEVGLDVQDSYIEAFLNHAEVSPRLRE